MILIPTCWAGEGTTILSTKGGILGTAGLESNTELDTTGYPVLFFEKRNSFYRAYFGLLEWLMLESVR